MKRNPPRIALRFFRWYCHPKLQDYIEGDLLEVYAKRMNKSGKWIADIRFVIDVLLLFRPGIIKPIEESQNVNNYGMFKSYFKIGWRNLVKDKGYSFINIGGLALGMTVAMLIGLWVWDEITYSKNFKNRDRIAAVMQNLTYGDLIETMSSQSLQLGPELRTAYGSNFKHVVMSSFTQSPILTYGEKSITKTGYFMEPEAPEMFALHMVTGSRAGLKNQNNILLSKSTAHALFGDKEAVGEVLKIDSRYDVIVTGVFEDLPSNSNFQDMLFLAPLDLLVQSGNQNLGWINNWLEVYVELEDGIDMTSASLAIKDAKLKNVDPSLAKFKPELFLFPLSRWHLYGDFENGINTGGRIEFVKLFGAIGGIVLLLACINFMNLSTARAENRAKEVGVRKVVGSLSHQLVSQFFIESFLMVFMAFLISLMMVQLTLPLFNEVANKKIEIDWINPWIWLFGLTIVFVTGLLAGSYPSFYLSRFSPGKVLKGSFRTGRLAALPRKVLVVAQFAISVALVIGTIVIYEQVQYAKSRPLGYQQNGLLFIPMKTQDAKASYQNVRNDLMAAGLAVEVSRSECTVTNMYWSDGGFKWSGKDPDMQDNIYRGAVDFEFGKSVNWKIKEGRDFSREFPSDSAAMILNEAAVAYMGLKNPVGEIVNRYGRDYKVIGVVENMVSQSLYEPVAQTYYVIDAFDFSQLINVKLNPEQSISEAILTIEKIFKKYNPEIPFEFQFADEKVADKFAYEARVGNLVGVFAVLAVVISCLGLFGLAAFMAGQRTKEIGIRKVVGASVISLWKLLSKDFLILIIIACVIAIPFAYLLMNSWLQQYTYRTHVSIWILLGTSVAAVAITVLTVSYQSIKAAMVNPVNTLKSE